MRGEKICEYDLEVTGLTDYCVTLDAILSGQAVIPSQGLRIDVAFDGRVTGQARGSRPRDRPRADGAGGRIDLDSRARWTRHHSSMRGGRDG